MSDDPSKQKRGADSPPSAPESRFWNDPAKRALLFQFLLIASICGVGYVMVTNTLNNLEQRGISTGFEFLGEEAGFGIPLSLVEYDESHTYGRTFLVGLLNTVLISVMGIISATILGFTLGIARLSDNWLISRLSTVYIEIFRNIPLLLQIFFWYFAVLRALPSPRQSIEFLGSFLNIRGLSMPSPVAQDGFSYVIYALVLAIILCVFVAKRSKNMQNATGQTLPVTWINLGLLIGLPLLVFLVNGMPMTLDHPELKGFNFKGGMTLIPELVALWLALTIYTAAFIAETVRGGILAVPGGQLEAASALGLPKVRTLRLIVIPQAMRVIIPPLTSQYLNLAKNSSLATAIGYPDLVSVFAGTTLNQTGRAIEVISMTMAVYLALSLLTSLFMNWYNKRMALVER
ncbi:MAG: amino acid ABC transporter permease [Pontibacterium sp.]